MVGISKATLMYVTKGVLKHLIVEEMHSESLERFTQKITEGK